MGVNRDMLTFVKYALEAADLKQAAGGPFYDIIDSGPKLARSLNERPQDVPLAAVAYMGTPAANTVATNRYLHAGFKTFVVFIVAHDAGGAGREMTTATTGVADLVEAIFDALAGLRPFRIDAAGVYLDADGAALTDLRPSGLQQFGANVPAAAVPLGHALEYVGDEPQDLPDDLAKRWLTGWAVYFRTYVATLPDRPEITAPVELEKIAGSLTPDPEADEIAVSVDPENADGAGIIFEPET